MWNRLKSKFFGKRQQEQISGLIAKVQKIRNYSDVLVLYGLPTKQHWAGIANATVSLFPDCSVAIPQDFSNPKLNTKDTLQLIQCIQSCGFNRIVISGFADYFFCYIDKLYLSSTIEVIFHGTIAEFHNPPIRQLMEKIILYNNEKKITATGFIKKGMAETFSKLLSMQCYHIPLPNPPIPKNLPKLILDPTKFHIGVFGSDTFNKNLHNQVIHALLIDNSVVHVLDKSHFDYLNADNRIVEHGKHLSREKFLSVLGSMDLNLYMSFSESWGLVAYESEAMGVPCAMPIEVDYLKVIKSFIKQ